MSSRGSDSRPNLFLSTRKIYKAPFVRAESNIFTSGRLVNYRYGSGPDEVDAFFNAKKPWSKVKDKIVGDYIHCYLQTIQRLERPILIVDGFSGPGRFGDGTAGSPLIICDAISATDKGRVGIGCLFADTHPGHRTALERTLVEHIKRGVSEKPFDDWSEALTRALEVGTNSTLFFYLDPYGIKDLEFDMVKRIYERDPRRSTEVLINFNFRTFMRMSGNWGYGDSASEVSLKVKAAKVDTVNRVMDGDYWKAIVTNPSFDKIAREDAVVNAYMERVRRFFPFVYAIPVQDKNETEYAVPGDELARYHLIFGTRSRRAVRYMNDVARNALAPYLNKFKDGLLFDMTPERRQSAPRDLVKEEIVKAVTVKPLLRPDIYEIVIPKFFMQYLVKDYHKMIDELTFKEGRLYPDRSTMHRKTQLNDKTLLSAKPWGIV